MSFGRTSWFHLEYDRDELKQINSNSRNTQHGGIRELKQRRRERQRER